MNSPAVHKAFAKQRLKFASGMLSTLLASGWPYEDSELALKAIKAEFDSILEELEGLDDDAGADIVASYGLQARSSLTRNIGYIGFMLRSADTRNSFEIYDPIKTVGKEILGNDVRLIVGSEWNYSPFVYPIHNESLENFVLVGLPATETQNALLVPIAGHELGHVLWRSGNIETEFRTAIRDPIIKGYQDNWAEVVAERLAPDSADPAQLSSNPNLFPIWTDSYKYAARQTEEVFCDCLGVYLFGEGFLRAFQYLLDPESNVRISDAYPTNRQRADILVRASISYGDNIGFEFAELFKHKDATLKVRIADEVTSQMSEHIIETIKLLLSDKAVARPSQAGKEKAKASLKSVEPPTELDTIADSLNAAWELRLDIGGWEIPGVENDRKVSVLNDLVLKSFEVLEWKRRKAAAC